MSAAPKAPSLIDVGIDAIHFYTPSLKISLSALAEARGIAPDKFTVGLGLSEMSVIPPDEDVVTMGAEAARPLLEQTRADAIHTLFFATESGIDQSKSAGIYLHRLLHLDRACRVVELKQACYSGTAALQMAVALVRQSPTSTALVVMSDVARYGLQTTGESSQGGGAVALLISAHPRILALNPYSGFITEDVMDFWRPNYRDEALVDGKYSVEVYLRILKECWQAYQAQGAPEFSAHRGFLFHTPIPRLAEKAYQKLRLTAGMSRQDPDPMEALLQHSLTYSRMIGNCYTASLYISLCALLDTHPEDLSHTCIGLYSYGSGCTGEFFSGTLTSGYHAVLHTKAHQDCLNQRSEISISEYESLYAFKLPEDGSHFLTPTFKTSGFRLTGIQHHQRCYEHV